LSVCIRRERRRASAEGAARAFPRRQGGARGTVRGEVRGIASRDTHVPVLSGPLGIEAPCSRLRVCFGAVRDPARGIRWLQRPAMLNYVQYVGSACKVAGSTARIEYDQGRVNDRWWVLVILVFRKDVDDVDGLHADVQI
jgi:hypothetical protein